MCANLTMPDTIMNSYIPHTVSVRNPQHDFLFHQMAAAFFYVATSQAVILRYTNDDGVWRLMNASLLGWDVILSYSLWNALNVQGILSPAAWRAEDLSAIIPTAVISASRAAIVCGFGLRNTEDPEVKRD